MTHERPETGQRTLLVTGASGFLGWHICRAAIPSWNVIGTCFTHSSSVEGATLRSVDLSDMSALMPFLDQVRPDAIIHAAALSQPNMCEVDPARSEAVNVVATRALAEWCEQNTVPMVFTSSDLVFDGQHGPYDESATPCPISVYGNHKVAAEAAVLSRLSCSTICRLPLLFGDRNGLPASFIGPWLGTLSRREPLSLFEDEIRTPVSGAVAAEGLLLMLENGVRGVIHLGGGERISRYAFGLKLAETFGLPSDSIRKVKLAEIAMPAPRPTDVSLDSTRAFELGYAPGSLNSQLKSIRKSMSQAVDLDT